MAIALRLKEQLVSSANKVNTRSKYYGDANPFPVVALRMVYDLLSLNNCNQIELSFECVKKLESLANNIIIKNNDICNLRGPNVFYQDRQDQTRVMVMADLNVTVDDNFRLLADGVNTFTFEYDDFTKNFNGTPEIVKILTLPSTGTLTVDGESVGVGTIVSLDNIALLLYTRIDDQYDDLFYFKTSNNETEKIFSNMATFTVNVDGEINQPATIGNGSTTNDYGVTVVFTRDMFTTNTVPAYNDPEGDVAATLKITSLPSAGLIKLNGVNINVNDEFDFTTVIDEGELTYVPDNSVVDSQALDFTFEIADAGSGEFVS
tara:strand:+ start:1556 stop:2512 length:957 start_codon:yes stop_codon:yes gene_type:complete